MGLTINDLISLVATYNVSGLKKVKQAYYLAETLHKGQVRQSGEEYIIHPLTVAYILAEMHADTDTICAALLHDTIEDTDITKEEIETIFNADVALLVDGVSKISKMNFSSKIEHNLANTRKIITGITKDVRIIIIKLADRLHNMRTLQYKTPFKQQENALETMEIFVPLAYYIGAYRIKSELEDLSLRYLKPDIYNRLEEKKLYLEEDSMPLLEEMKENIEDKLNEREIFNHIKIRTKNIYGIYTKLESLNSLSNIPDLLSLKIHDLLALKVMVNNIDNCYITLGMIHSLYNPVNSKFKDYIFNSKTNMYQSLHTTVFNPDGNLVQTQIRTFKMDEIASFGLTACWYQECEARKKMQEELRNKYQFFKNLTDIDTVFDDNKDFVDQIKNELFADKVYVYTIKGDIIELPKGSTPIDFAYRIHPDIGNTMVSAIVNDEEVPLEYELKNKDRVKIITNVLSLGPSEDWLDSAKTTNAKTKIKEFTGN